jgi:CDGSH-type Zn-finger protein
MKKNQKVLITKNGPYLVSGNLPLAKEIAAVGKEGEPEEWKKGKQYPKQENYSLCRCGNSKNNPFCDETHTKINFDGTETANRKEYIKQAEKLSGPEIDLTDVKELCSTARFCHLAGGTWSNVKNSNNPKSKKIAIQTACNCPSGRLVVWGKNTQEPIEPKFEPSIGIIEDCPAKVSGPIWLKGGVILESSDGTKYEKRNRCTLCRCGKSNNKPFCDGSHIEEGFNDGDESLKK